MISSARAAAYDDFAVLGDWNRRTGLPGDTFAAIVIDDDPPRGRLLFTDAGRKAACVARYPDFIDHIAMRQNSAERVLPGSFAGYTYDSAEAEHPSDHSPRSVVIGRDVAATRE